mgnify:CR=1 FL=1
MKKVVRLTESELVNLVKRVISEQNDILSKKGYVLGDVNKLSGKEKEVVTKFMEKYPNYQYYTKKGSSLISDGEQVIFIVIPKGWGGGIGPHKVNDVETYINESKHEDKGIFISKGFKGVRSEFGGEEYVSPQDIIDAYNDTVEEGTPLVEYLGKDMFLNDNGDEIDKYSVLDELNYAILGREDDEEDDYM